MQNLAKTTNQHHNQLKTEIEGQNKKKNRKPNVGSVINMVTQRRTASHHAGIVIFQDITIEIVLKGKIEAEAKAEEEQEEEMTLLLDKEDSHLKEENIPLIQKEKEKRREAKTIGLEMTVLASQDQTQTDPADLSQDLDQKQSKTHLQEKRSGRSNRDRGRYNKGDYHKNDRIVAAHKNRRIGGKANPSPPLNVTLFREAS